jgi:hypothetical protein
MGAREKLNRLAALGCVGAAGVVGIASNSWWAFAIALAVTLGLCVTSRDIRLKLVRRRPWRRPAHR